MGEHTIKGVCCTCQEAHSTTQNNKGWGMLPHTPSFDFAPCEGSGTFPQALIDAPKWAQDDFYRQADGEDR